MGGQFTLAKDGQGQWLFHYHMNKIYFNVDFAILKKLINGLPQIINDLTRLKTVSFKLLHEHNYQISRIFSNL